MSVIKNRIKVAASSDNWDGDDYAARNARLCAAYQAALAEANGLDFDDMLLATVRTLHEHPDARRAVGDRFPRVLVDEYQDTNLPQYVLVRQLAEGGVDPVPRTGNGFRWCWRCERVGAPRMPVAAAGCNGSTTCHW